MANSSPDPELNARIARIDAEQPSPSDRATRVWHLLQTYDPDLTTWDVLCFCAEFMGLVSQRYHWMLPLSKRFVSLVYSAHYYDETRVDAVSDRITRKVESGDSDRGSDTGPKSLFDVSRSFAPSERIGRSDQ